MNVVPELRLVCLALRDHLTDPAQLAEAGLSWSPAEGPLLTFLVARGLLTRDQLDHLTRSAAETPAPNAASQTDPPTADYVPTAAYVPSDPSAFAGPVNGSAPTATAPRGTDTAACPTDFIVAEPLEDERLGGRYQRLRLHRSGGLGHVWLARDTAIDRDVALKTIKSEWSGSTGALARFLREARVTGRLEHPGIVPLYDLSTVDEAGGPWYTMRFVSGKTLAEATHEYHHRQGKGSAGPLEFAGLLDAFVAVCRAVAFAHSRGVLHRDLKGQNVVLGQFGEVFLLDWGLAKPIAGPDNGSTAPAPNWDAIPMTTVDGAVAGTPAFMAPEVAAGGPATTATDVYSLGAVLYTILTGKLPVEGTTARDAIEKIIAEAPPRPRTVNSTAPPALEAVCLKAMARSPADRYATADELATDVRRWLADEPVSAYREPLAVRAMRWARRHRTAVATAAAVLVTAALALAVTTALVWREQRATAAAQGQAEAQWARAEEEKARATENFLTVRSLVVDLGNRIAAIETGRVTSQQMDLRRKQALDTAIAGFQRFQAANPDDPLLRQQVSLLHRFAANVARSLNDVPAAESSYRAAIRGWEELAKQFPRNANYPQLLAETLWDYAALLRTAGRLSDAASALDRSVNLAEQIRKDGVPEAHYRRTLASALLERADVEHLRGQFAASEATARKSVELYDRLRDAPPGQANPVDPLLAAMAVNQVAMALRDGGRPADALAVHNDAVARLDKLAGPNAGPDVTYWSARVRLERAESEAAIPARRAPARADFDKAIGLLESLVTNYPQSPLYQKWLAVALLGRGRLAVPATAPEPDLTRARELLENLVQQYHDLPDYRGLLGRTYLALGERAKAVNDAHAAADWFGKAESMLKGAQKHDPENVLHRRAAEELERAQKSGKP